MAAVPRRRCIQGHEQTVRPERPRQTPPPRVATEPDIPTTSPSHAQPVDVCARYGGHRVDWRAAPAFGLLEPYEWISANRQTLAQRTGDKGATKAHDEVLQRTQVPPRPGSHQRLLARCSLRTPPCGGYKCRRTFCDDKHDLFDVDPTNNIQARRLCIAVSYSRLNAALNEGWKIGYVRQQSAVRTPRQSGYGRPRRPISWSCYA